MFQIFESVKKEGVQFYDIFPQTEWLKRSFSYLSIILPLDFWNFEYFFKLQHI